MLWFSDALEHEGYDGLAWMLWFSDAVEQDRYYGLDMDAQGFRFLNALEHERCYGLGIDALVIGCTRT